jgi:hypothetical protein
VEERETMEIFLDFDDFLNFTSLNLNPFITNFLHFFLSQIRTSNVEEHKLNNRENRM